MDSRAEQGFLIANLSQLQKMFLLNDEKIEESEFVSAYLETNPQLEKDEAIREAKSLFKAADADQNGSISFAEWCAADLSMRSSSSPNKMQN